MTHRWHRLQTRFGTVAFPEKIPPARGILRCNPIWVVTHARRRAHDDAQVVEASCADAGVDRHRGSGTCGSWFRTAQATHEARVRAGGVKKDFAFVAGPKYRSLSRKRTRWCARGPADRLEGANRPFPTTEETNMQIARSSSTETATGPSEWFTGTV